MEPTGKNTIEPKELASDSQNTASQKTRNLSLAAEVNSTFTADEQANKAVLYRDRKGKVAFIDHGKKLSSNRDTADVAVAMVKLAESKGWARADLDGTAEFQAKVAKAVENSTQEQQAIDRQEPGNGAKQSDVDQQNVIEPGTVTREQDMPEWQVERNKQLVADLNQEFMHNEQTGNYFFREGDKTIAFTDYGGVKIASTHDRADVADAMAKLAESKGWDPMNVEGSNDFFERVRKALEKASNEQDAIIDKQLVNAVERDDSAEAEKPQTKAAEQTRTAEKPIEAKPAKTEKAAKTAKETEKSDDELQRRRATLAQQVADQFRQSGSRYYFKDTAGQVNNLAFKATDRRLSTGLNTERVTTAIVMLAESRGWGRIKVSGHREFKRQVWLEASKRGIAVRGYEPDEKDKAKLTTLQETQLSNNVERQAARQSRQNGAERTSRVYSGTLVDHGTAPYKDDSKNNQSYFVTLENASGKQKLWGVDLEKRIADANASRGTPLVIEFKGKQAVEIDVDVKDATGTVTGTKKMTTHRNTWSVEQADKQQVIETVSEKLLESGTLSESERQRLQAELRHRAQMEAKAGPLPSVPMYDNKARQKQHNQQQEHVPEKEKQSELTR